MRFLVLMGIFAAGVNAYLGNIGAAVLVFLAVALLAVRS